MKKKLLSILLSLAMVLTMMPMATMTAFAEQFSTIGAVLGTVDFPTGVPNAWVCESNRTKIIYKTDDSLIIGTVDGGSFSEDLSFNCSIDSAVVQSEESYICEIGGCGTMEFKMAAGVLASISLGDDTYSPVTIDSILPVDFPTSSHNAWYNSSNDDTCIYKDDTHLIFYNNPISVSLSSALKRAERTQDNDSFTCTFESVIDDISIQFNMNGDAGNVLKNIVVSRCTYKAVVGIYNAPEPASHSHGTGTEPITFEKEIKTFTDLQDLFNTGGSGYLANNITATAGLTVAASKTVNLCLNDKVLNLNKKGNITVATGAKFNLYDCGEDTTRYYDKDATTGLWTLNTAKSSGDYTTTGGVITGGSTVGGGSGGGVLVKGTFNMYGGNIVGNETIGSTEGGGVYVGVGSSFAMTGESVISGNVGSSGAGVSSSGTFDMSGDSRIVGNTATGKHGGGVNASNLSVSFTMSDNSKITGNEAKMCGGGVYVGGGSFAMTGGEISGNNATNGLYSYFGGGVFFGGNTITLGGTAKITGNTAGSTIKTANNLDLLSGKAIILGTNTNAPVTTDAGKGKMSIGVTMNTPGVFTGANGADYSALFTPDAGTDNYKVINLASDSNKLKLVTKDAVTVDSNVQNGTVMTNAADDKAFEGDNVTVTVTPNSGYRLKANTLLVKYNDGEEKTITPQATQTAGQYTFQMPGYAVTVTAEFEPNDADKNVAKIGDKTYATLADALAAANANDTIILQKDITIDKQLVIDKAITFDGNGKTITRTPGGADADHKAGILVTAGATIKNLTVSGPNSSGNKWDDGEFGIKLYKATGATLNNVTVTKANAGIQVNFGSVAMTGTINVSGNEFGGIELCHGGALDISDATLKNDGETDAKPVLWNDDTKGTIIQNKSQMLYVKVADENKDHYYLSGEAMIGDSGYRYFTDALAASKFGEKVELGKDITSSTTNVTVPEGVFLDLNHHALNTTGTVTNSGCIILHKENADIVDYLLYNVPGNYGTSEELKLPNDAAPDYVIPANTFMTAEVGKTPVAYQELGFASGVDMLVWNKDVPAGMQLDVMYSLKLGGNILSAKTSGIKDTNVTAVNFALNDNIIIGSNTDNDGKAVLNIISLYDETFGDEKATFNANDKKITLNKTGKLVISSDATGFDEGVLVSGEETMTVAKSVDESAKTTTYFIAPNAPIANEGYSINYVTEEINIEEGYEISKVADPNFTPETLTGNKLAIEPGTNYYVRKKAVSGTPASVAATFKTAERPAAPATPVLGSKTTDTIVVAAQTGQEYSIDNGKTWVTDNGAGTITFSGLTAGTTYTIVTRTAAVNTDGSEAFASSISGALSVTTDSGYTPGPAPTPSEPTIIVPVSGDEGKVEISATVSGEKATVGDISEKDIEKVVSGDKGDAIVEIDLSGLDKTISEVELPVKTVEKIAEATKASGKEEAGMSVKMSAASVTFDAKATQAMVDQAEGNTIQLVVDDIKTVSLNAVQKEAVEKLDTAIIIDAYLVSNGIKLCTESKNGFAGGKATVALQYEIKNNRTPLNYKVFYVDDNGKLTNLKAKYNEETKSFVFDIEHFSNYAVAYDENGELQASKVNLTKTTTYKNGKIKLTFKGLKLSDGKKITSYQIYRSTSKKFNKNLKKYSIKRTANTKSYTWTNSKKLKKGTKYYYKVRGRVKLSDGTYAYTQWSKVKTAKCKRSR